MLCDQQFVNQDECGTAAPAPHTPYLCNTGAVSRATGQQSRDPLPDEFQESSAPESPGVWPALPCRTQGRDHELSCPPRVGLRQV